MKIPNVFDIKRTSTADGPGVRTCIFFKGCNLNCDWCHNPEGKSSLPQTAFFAQKCISCGSCACDKDPCNACGDCARTCPTQARKHYGTRYTADELVAIILRDKTYYDATGGGVTFSGGECLLYPEFLAAVAAQCKTHGIHVAVDTAGCVPFSHFDTVDPYVDLYLYDIKCLDPELHYKGTGVRNELILNNLNKLLDCKKSILVRTPDILNFNHGEELNAVLDYCNDRGLPIEVLPYHAFGESKKLALSAHCDLKKICKS